MMAFPFEGEFTTENLCVGYYRAGKSEAQYIICEFDDYALSRNIDLKSENYSISLKQYKQFLKLMCDADLSITQNVKVSGGDQNEKWTSEVVDLSMMGDTFPKKYKT